MTLVQSSYRSRSPRTGTVSAPAALSLLLNSETSSERSTRATRPPSLATPAATPSPMPCADPVTTATLPSNRPAWITGAAPRRSRGGLLDPGEHGGLGVLAVRDDDVPRRRQVAALVRRDQVQVVLADV